MSVKFSNTKVISAGKDGSIISWDISSGSKGLQTPFVFKGHPSRVTAMEICDYKHSMVASSSEDGMLCIWDT